MIGGEGLAWEMLYFLKVVIPFQSIMECRVNWDKHERNISEAFQRLRKDEHFYDVTLASEEHQFQAHRVVLSGGSSFF